jgi:HlyD family secretion protein
MKRKILAALLVIAFVAGAGAWLYRRDWRTQSAGGADTLTLYGNIDIREAQLAFFEAEQIEAVLVEEGDKVVPGQLLARLRTDRLEAQIAEARHALAAQWEIVQRLENGTRPQEIARDRAAVASARVQFTNAEVRFRRLETTRGTGATSQQDLDNARTQLDVAQAELEARQKTLALAVEGPRAEYIAEARQQWQAQAAHLDFLERRLADTYLYAPAAGVVQSRILEPGEVAGPDKPVLILALTARKWVRAYVPEPDLGRLASGMRASVSSDSFPGQSYTGWVGFISPTAEFTPKNVETADLRTKLVYEVRVFVDDPHNELRLGMPVTVEIARHTATEESAPADHS